MGIRGESGDWQLIVRMLITSMSSSAVGLEAAVWARAVNKKWGRGSIALARRHQRPLVHPLLSYISLSLDLFYPRASRETTRMMVVVVVVEQVGRTWVALRSTRHWLVHNEGGVRRRG